MDALNDALALWLRPRLAAVRAADPDRLVTVAHVDTILATLPVNAWTDYRTYHRYPSATPAGIRSALNLWDDVRKAVPGLYLFVSTGAGEPDTPVPRRNASFNCSRSMPSESPGGSPGC